MSSTDKVIVTDVADGCAASGLVMKGDKVLAINGTPVTDEIQARAMARAAVGEVVFSILRGTAHMTITVDKPEATTRLGVTMKNPMPAGHPQAQPLKKAKVIVTDVADGCAASGLVMKGDKVLAINGTPVTDEIQGRVLAKAAVGEVVFSVLRGDARVTVAANKPEATTRLGVTMKNPVPAGHPQAQPPKPLVIYAEPVAAYDYAPEYDDYEPPTRTNRYEQNSEWPGLFDCCSAGNSLCLYAYCCMPCLAGQMYSNVFKREPGCCTKLSGMRAFVYAFLGFIMIVGTGHTELGVNLRTFLASAPFLIPLPGMIFSVIMVYTLFKVRQELRSRSRGRLSGGSFEDCLVSYCCSTCVTVQLARYLGFDVGPYNVFSATGIPV